MDDIAPTYFYLTHDSFRVQWLYNKPRDCEILGTVEWKFNAKLIVNINICCTRYTHKLLTREKYQSSTNNHLSPKFVSVLRSQLQKLVRRENPTLALKTALAMYQINDPKKKTLSEKEPGVEALLRRLSIIMVEDSIVIPSFSFVLWCQAIHSKGFVITSELFKHILGIVDFVASNGWKDMNYKKVQLKKNINFRQMISENRLTPIQSDILWSLQFRKSYGGMSQDIVMLDRSTYMWCNRFVQKDKLCMFFDHDFSYSYDGHIKPLSKNDIILESIDQHSSNIVSRIADVFKYDEHFITK